MKSSFLEACSLGLAGLLIAGHAGAQQPKFPDKPIRLVVPYAAGGGNDTVARLVGEALTKDLGQPVIVENRAGAGGNIGSDYVAKAPADGYTLLHVSNTVVVNPSLYRKLPFDVQKDLAPVGLIATSPILILSNPKAGIDSLATLAQRMKGGGADLSYATPGTGTPHHFAMALLASRLQSGVVHVPYKGASPALTDVVGGQVPLLISTPQSVSDFIANGRLKLLATMEPARVAPFKDTPVVAEAMPGFSVSIWHGLVTPAATPKPVVDALSASLARVLAQPELLGRLQTVGFQGKYESPALMKQRIQDELPTWKKVADAAGIVPE